MFSLEALQTRNAIALALIRQGRPQREALDIFLGRKPNDTLSIQGESGSTISITGVAPLPTQSKAG